MGKIGILGGTFDPPHLGHLILAEEVRVTLQLEEIWFIPTYEPPHKAKSHTSSADRITMLKKSIEGNGFFKIHPIELNREGKSYTIDTVTELRKQNPQIEFYFIIGADMVEYLPHWKSIDDLIQLIHFVGVNRPGHKLQTPYPVTEVDIPSIDLSSTFIRNRIQHGQSVTYLIPKSVHTYIKENGLYGHRSSH